MINTSNNTNTCIHFCLAGQEALGASPGEVPDTQGPGGGLYICMYVCMYVCVYIYIYTHTYIHREREREREIEREIERERERDSCLPSHRPSRACKGSQRSKYNIIVYQIM